MRPGVPVSQRRAPGAGARPDLRIVVRRLFPATCRKPRDIFRGMHYLSPIEGSATACRSHDEDTMTAERNTGIRSYLFWGLALIILGAQ